MNNSDKAYLEEAEHWVKGEMLAIESCQLSIDHYQKQINLNQRFIKSEKEQIELKEKTIAEVKKQMEEVRNRNKE